MNEHELQRQAKYRLAILRHVEEVTGNVAATCRYYGISRQRFYRWQRRYAELGVAGLRDRSKRPHHCPKATSDEVIGKVIHLRQHYHFGPLKISMYLQRYHDVEISQSGVWRILKRLDMNRLPSSQRHKPLERRWKRYEKQQPGHRIQMDVKFIEPLHGARKPRYYQYTAIDDCTRLRVLRIYDRNNQNTAIQFLDYVCQKLPFRVDTIQTDNGSEFGAQFHWHVLDRGIRHVYIKPATQRSAGRNPDRGSGGTGSGTAVALVCHAGCRSCSPFARSSSRWFGRPARPPAGGLSSSCSRSPSAPRPIWFADRCPCGRSGVVSDAAGLDDPCVVGWGVGEVLHPILDRRPRRGAGCLGGRPGRRSRAVGHGRARRPAGRVGGP